MKNSGRIFHVFVFTCALLLSTAIPVFLFGKTVEEEPFIDVANRWAIIIDAVDRQKTDGMEAFRPLRSELEKAGLLSDHILVYSASDPDPARRPTKENFLKILDGVRNQDQNRFPAGTGTKTDSGSEVRRPLRTKQGICELQIYLTAVGVTDKEQTRNMIVPSDVAPEEIKSVNDERLLLLDEVEDAMIRPEAEKDGIDHSQNPIERTLFVVNFISFRAIMRGRSVETSLRDPRIAKVAARNMKNDHQEIPSIQFCHLRILTKNENPSDTTAGSFYETLCAGLNGYADISGNQDHVVQAGELVEYLKGTFKLNGLSQSVETAQNGNDLFPIAPSRYKLTLSESIFREIENIFVLKEFQPEKESARLRGERIRNSKSSSATKRGMTK